MTTITFHGFGGIELRADALGSTEDPSVLLMHGGCESREVWKTTADALVKAGRYVINLDLRGHGDSDKPTDQHYNVRAFKEDLRAVLAQINSRPVIIASPLGGWIATAVLGETNLPLASGLVLADSPINHDSEIACTIKENLVRRAQNDPNTSWDPAFVTKFDSAAAIAEQQKAAPKLKVPTLYVRGQVSEVTTSKSVKHFLSLIEDAESVEIENAGHSVAFDRVDEFNAVVLDFLERKNPRFRPDYMAGSDPRILRDAMGCFATGVAIVTAMTSDNQPIGLTVNSFTSVSLDPPLVLVCIANTVNSLAILEEGKHFAINMLHIGQQPVSNLFARPGEDRFTQTAWQPGDNNAPLLSNSLANVECSRHAVFDGGDHIILVGHVDRVRFDPRRDPLLYFSGKYRRLHLS